MRVGLGGLCWVRRSFKLCFLSPWDVVGSMYMVSPGHEQFDRRIRCI